MAILKSSALDLKAKNSYILVLSLFKLKYGKTNKNITISQ